MSLFYLPGCKFTKYDPAASDKLAYFCKSRLDAQVLGCCSKDFNTPRPGDTVLYVCPTCALIMKESNSSVTLKSIHEAILEYDETLCSSDNPYNTQNKTCIQWVDLQKKEITVQDCWRSREDPALQLAIRKALSKMNATIRELDNNFNKADYCGLSLLKEPSPRYEWLAPKLFQDPIFKPHSPEEQIRSLSNHVQQYTTSAIGCYCTGCVEGIERVNALFSSNEASGTNTKRFEPIHIASLLAQSIKLSQADARLLQMKFAYYCDRFWMKQRVCYQILR